jgi:hypothetical protein
MARARLPNRRPALTREIEHAGHRFSVTIGFDLCGRPREVFAGGAKLGTDLGHMIADHCVTVSLALQHGCTGAELEKSMGVVPDPASEPGVSRPASVFGVIAAIVAEVGRQTGPGA